MPFTTVSFGDGVASVWVWVWGSVWGRCGVGVGVGVAGSGLVAVPAAGAQEALGLVSPHHSLLLFSCQIVPLT